MKFTSLMLAVVALLVISSTASATDLRSISCKIEDVAIAGDRVHVRCTEVSPAPSGVIYYAVSTTDEDAALRYQTMAQAALLNGRKLTIGFDADDVTSGPPIGCASANCRVAIHAALLF